VRPRLLILVGSVFLAGCDVRSDVPLIQELKKWQGTWDIVRTERDGQPDTDEAEVTFRLVGEHYVIKTDDEVTERGRLVIDPTKAPKQCSFHVEFGPDLGKQRDGIYVLTGDTLRLCMAQPGEADRPMELASTNGHCLMVLQMRQP
jgi:uncharacterized protein (TIGR03067 family)